LNQGCAARVEEAFAAVAARTGDRPEVAVVLGSGLGAFAETFGGTEVGYASISGFPVPTVAGHRGVLRVRGKVALFAGRFHYYEGFEPEDLAMPVLLARRLGAKTLILTNAAGAIRRELEPGGLVLIRDHINLMGMNPLRGPHVPELGPRFPDMSSVYPRHLRDLSHRVAGDAGPLAEGVYAALAGPCYETPAEIRALEAQGADLVGMSTVPEAIVASWLGMEVLGISCVTNMAAGVLDRPLSHEEVLETGRRVAPRFAALLEAVLAGLCA
jgi:purine-nucleoside phosphorylase